jgi:hypothetical protein
MQASQAGVDRNSSRSTQLGELLGAYSLSEWVKALTLTLHVEPPLILKDLVQLLQQIFHFDFFFLMCSTYLILFPGHLAILKKLKIEKCFSVMPATTAFPFIWSC